MFCIHYHLAEVYLALGRPEDAARRFRKQREAVPAAGETRRAKSAGQSRSVIMKALVTEGSSRAESVDGSWAVLLAGAVMCSLAGPIRWA
jgi:hypothetical protein